MRKRRAGQPGADGTVTMGWLDRLWGTRRETATDRLYAAVVAPAREEHWYLDGAVPDTVDGRFEMVSTILALLLLRFEGEPGAGRASAELTEAFVADMDGQLRQIGVGDVVVGKHVGKMMALLGGRLGALRDARSGDALRDVVLRNVYRGEDFGPAALTHTRDALADFDRRLADTAVETLLRGELP